MWRVQFAILCGMLVCSNLACAPYRGPTAQGYYFRASAFPSSIKLLGGLPTSSTLMVDVRDDKKSPVDAVPITFEIEPQCKGTTSLSASNALTRRGTARVAFTANAPGSCRIAVSIDNETEELQVEIAPAPSFPTHTGG